MPPLPVTLTCVTLLVAACNVDRHTVPPPAALSYNSSSPFPAIVGVPISLAPTVTGMVDNYSIAPALPRGLSLGTLDGIISGIPAIASGQARYAITASNAAGDATFGLELSVTRPPSKLSYDSPVETTAGVAITPLTPAIAGEVELYDILPTLPPGLEFDINDGVISGTPSVARTPTPYTITARSFAGQTSFVLVLTVTSARRHSH